MALLIFDVPDLRLQVGDADRAGVIPPAPEVALRVAERELLLDFEELPRGSSLEEMRRHYVVHPLGELGRHVDMVGHDRQLHYAYAVPVRCLPYAGSH